MLTSLGAAHEAGLGFHFLLPLKNPLDSRAEGCLKILFFICPLPPHMLSTTDATVRSLFTHPRTKRTVHQDFIARILSKTTRGGLGGRVQLVRAERHPPTVTAGAVSSKGRERRRRTFELSRNLKKTVPDASELRVNRRRPTPLVQSWLSTVTFSFENVQAEGVSKSHGCATVSDNKNPIVQPLQLRPRSARTHKTHHTTVFFCLAGTPLAAHWKLVSALRFSPPHRLVRRNNAVPPTTEQRAFHLLLYVGPVEFIQHETSSIGCVIEMLIGSGCLVRLVDGEGPGRGGRCGGDGNVRS
ncbi:hypothetical protein GEV33_012457 [Tenebrio molitor]|uniref:Uncharacterized protein n=1 Tax=Tenebrio molitor TaxID=7067 RepID=A0A8J6HA88_TENMO|nr:hypothetical protein GEV33_012457 [Tenebrio molitor]